ncbi:MAG: hypothetical protein A2021_08560 [Elusimicrobia bacterium GWF2_52_66]|nr:MAG: hypothetical protein A2X33_11235 [Elusimicrobia bacterium GWA2_51_34]OGR85019.1 MAG: hypothetical protein A2021_08560 [Elusimicrobia bacterium GWF2_52_66]
MKKYLLGTFLALLFLPSQLIWGKTVVVYHTSDIHGYFNGFPALSALVKKEKNPHLLVDSGDWFQGTPEGNLSKGANAITLMNAVGYNAAVVGNHDYDYSENNLKELSAAAKFKMLGAVYSGGSPVNYTAPYEIVAVDGVRIALVGVQSDRTKYTVAPANIAGLTFNNGVAEVTQRVAEVKKQSVNAVIVLAHSPTCEACATGTPLSEWIPSHEDLTRGNLAMARAVKGDVAVIMGGHVHTVFPQGYYDSESGTLFVESGSKSSGVTRVQLEFDDTTGRFKGAKAQYMALSGLQEDTEIKTMLKAITDEVGGIMDKTIGEAAAAIPREGPTLDSPIANWVNDAMKKFAGTQIALINSTGLRNGFPRGKLTLRDVYQVLPFDNYLVTLDIPGERLEALLKNTVTPERSKIQVSEGVTIRYSLSSDSASVTDIKVFFNGAPLDPNAVYSVATADFYAGVITGAANLHNTNVLVRDVLNREVKESSPITPPRSGRIELVK